MIKGGVIPALFCIPLKVWCERHTIKNDTIDQIQVIYIWSRHQSPFYHNVSLLCLFFLLGLSGLCEIKNLSLRLCEKVRLIY